jgi:hypothetical protein
MKPAMDLQTAKVRFAELNAELNRKAAAGEITVADASRLDSAMARLAETIRAIEGDAVMSGEDANRQNRKAPRE